jgi:hypothetical protein
MESDGYQNDSIQNYQMESDVYQNDSIQESFQDSSIADQNFPIFSSSENDATAFFKSFTGSQAGSTVATHG